MRHASGNWPGGAPAQRLRRDDLVFRVFVSSTFRDLQNEREALQQFVWPALEKHCRMREAFFQAIDLRWGISAEASLDQQTMNICAAELRRCQELSPCPNFIILLGNRYGWCPLPAQIPAEEFRELLAHVPDADDIAFLVWDQPPTPPPTGMCWYALDRNAGTPPCERPGDAGEYVLRRRRSGTSEAERDTWETTEARLRAILLDAMRRARWAEDDPRRWKYVHSAVHQEIEHGAFHAPAPEQHVFAYLRDIVDPSQAAVASGIADGDQARVAALRGSVQDLIPHNTRQYSVRWGGGSSPLACEGSSASMARGAEEQMPWHAARDPYIARLCADVYDDLKGVIDREMSAHKALPGSQRERAIHARHGQDAGQLLVGRDPELAAVAAYIDSASRGPLLVCGPHGMGKTALLARAWMSHSGEGTGVFRSIGATPRSTDLQHLLHDIALELCPDREVPGEDEALVGFMGALAQAGGNGKVIIWLDGLDRLTSQHEAHLFAWFPAALPARVKLIASADPEGRQVRGGLAALRKRVPDGQAMELQPLSALAGPGILDSWLGQEGRSLQPSQSEAILQAFAACPRPLMLRLAYLVARRWHSWDAPVLAGRQMGSFNALPELLVGILKWAGLGHGEALVRRAFGCISVSREGLTENELLAMLSRDSQLLSEMLSRHPDSPPVAQLPPIVWYRLFRDVELMLGLRQVDTFRTLSFTHGLIADVVRSQFLSPGGEERVCRLALAEYFETEGVGTRQADELPCQLDALEQWARLAGVLLNVPLSELVWQRHGAELVQYWARIREHGGVADIAQAYGDRWRKALNQGTIPTSVAAVLGNLGHAAAAESIVDAVIEWLRRRGEPSDELGAALCGKARLLEARRNHHAARPLLREALAIYRALHRWRACASCLSDLAGTMIEDAPDEALLLLSEAESVWREARSPEGVAVCLGNQANIHIRRGNTGDAVRLQREAVRLCRESSLLIQTAEHQCSLGAMLGQAGEVNGALENLRAAETVYREAGLRGPLGACLGQMASICARQGDLRHAFDMNEEALAFMRDSGQHVWLATCLLNQARLSLEVGEYTVGRQRAEEALQEIRQCSAPAALRQECLALLFELGRRAANTTRTRGEETHRGHP